MVYTLQEVKEKFLGDLSTAFKNAKISNLYELLRKKTEGNRDSDIDCKYFFIKYGIHCVECYCVPEGKIIAALISTKEGNESIYLELKINQENKLEIIEESQLPSTTDSKAKFLEFKKRINRLEQLILGEK